MTKKLPNLIAPKNILPHLSTKLHRAMLNYLLKFHNEKIFDEVCTELRVTKDYLLADDNWVSVQFDEEYSKLIRLKTGDPEIFEKLGMFFLAPENINPVEYQILRAASPFIVFSNIGHYLKKINRVCAAEVCRKSLGKFEIKVSISEPNLFYNDMILNFQGVFKAICELYRLKNISVRSKVANDNKSVTYHVDYSATGYYSKYFLNGFCLLGGSAILSYSITQMSDVLVFITITILLATLMFCFYLIYKSKHLMATIESHTSFYYRTSQEKNFQIRLTSELMDKKEIQQRLVAHDIRSPLSVLNMLLPSLRDSVTDERAHLAAQAIERVNSIAEELLQNKRTMNEGTLFFVSVKNVIESIIKEKATHCENLGLNIKFELADSENKDVWIAIGSSDVSRIISNVVNNSIEAISHEFGLIKIGIFSSSNELTLVITDNGRGMSQDSIEQVGIKGYTHGKVLSGNSGYGLGLYHAKETIEQAGGIFKIQSVVDRGTALTLKIPIYNPDGVGF